jgi:hypothetical protein
MAMTEEKPLEKHTVKELKEMALALGGISGVTGMKKDELIEALKKARGIPEKKLREKPVESVLGLKKSIRELRQKREGLKEEGRGKQTLYLKRRINRLKKRLRRLSRKAAEAKA